MTTTAARSRDWLRKQGYVAEVVEHRYGKFRKDLLDIGDTIGLPPTRLMPEGTLVKRQAGLIVHAEQQGILLVQAYLDTKANREKHAHLNLSHPMVLHWRAVGGRYEHHRWKKVKGRWKVEVVAI